MVRTVNLYFFQTDRYKMLNRFSFETQLHNHIRTQPFCFGLLQLGVSSKDMILAYHFEHENYAPAHWKINTLAIFTGMDFNMAWVLKHDVP